MTEGDLKHCRIVQNCITGRRPLDEKTLASLAVLDERLRKLKKQGGAFRKITFSPAVKELQRRKNAVAVG